MRVLTWQSFGQVRVMAAETPMHFFKIFQAIELAMAGWNEELAIMKLAQSMNLATNQEACERVFTRWIKPHVGTHEAFELFDFTTVED